MVHPIIDQYYNYNPYHRRSSKFVQDKGLVTNEKGASGTPAVTPGIANNDHKKSLIAPGIRDSLASTLAPSIHTRTASPSLLAPLERVPLQQTSVNSATASASDLRVLASLSNREHSKPQEQVNIKKKRASLSNYQPPRTQSVPDSPEPRPAAYGDPLKIAQYFPELN